MKPLSLRLAPNRLGRIGLAVAAVLAVVLSASFAASVVHPAAPATPLTAASGSVQQWAFGGVASASYSCSNAGCYPGDPTPPPGTISVSAQYYFEWVVIYTQTNVSSTQTMYEAQGAWNVSLKETYSLNSTSDQISVFGKLTSVGFTNVTNTASVDVLSGGPLGATAALGIENAASNAAFNFSGSDAFTNSSNASQDGTLNFDFGANEASSVAFATPLGIVPLAPVVGETWGDNATFSATGGWTTGYSFSGSFDGAPVSTTSNWTSGSVASSGNLFANGTDLGQYTLWDNYTTPPTTTTSQLIVVQFYDGVFSATDGWVLIPVGMFGIFGLLESDVASTHSLGPAVVPAQSPTLTDSESVYYQQGPGFIGATASGNVTSTDVGSGASGPSVSLSAGPEPVSVAQGQYSGVTGSSPPSSSSSSSSSFPWTWLILGVVVVVVVVLGALLMVRRRRQPPTAAASGAPATGPAPPGSTPASGPSAPTPPAQTAVAAAAAGTPPCPTCGQPSTYVAQYNRYYCYTDKQYL